MKKTYIHCTSANTPCIQLPTVLMLHCEEDLHTLSNTNTHPVYSYLLYLWYTVKKTYTH